MEEETKQEESQTETQSEEKPLDTMTLKELREIARDIPGVSGFSVMQKPELFSLIKKHRGIEDDTPIEKPELKKPLEKMTVPELKEIAKVIPRVTGVTAMKKDELIALIKKDRGLVDETPAEKKEKKATRSTLTAGELKKKIVALRADKEQAREAGERQKIDVLRRRINRLKKRTRKAAQG